MQKELYKFKFMEFNYLLELIGIVSDFMVIVRIYFVFFQEIWLERVELVKRKFIRKLDREGRGFLNKDYVIFSINLIVLDGNYVRYLRFEFESDRVELLLVVDYDINSLGFSYGGVLGYGMFFFSRVLKNIFDDLQ